MSHSQLNRPDTEGYPQKHWNMPHNHRDIPATCFDVRVFWGKRCILSGGFISSAVGWRGRVSVVNGLTEPVRLCAARVLPRAPPTARRERRALVLLRTRSSGKARRLSKRAFHRQSDPGYAPVKVRRPAMCTCRRASDLPRLRGTGGGGGGSIVASDQEVVVDGLWTAQTRLYMLSFACHTEPVRLNERLRGKSKGYKCKKLALSAGGGGGGGGALEPQDGGGGFRRWDARGQFCLVLPHADGWTCFLKEMFTPLVYVQNDLRVMGVVLRYLCWGTHRLPPGALSDPPQAE